MRIEQCDPLDDADVARHIEFEQRHGRARFTNLDAFRSWVKTVDRLVLWAAFEGTEMVGCSVGSVVHELAPTDIQINAFVDPGRSDVLRQLADAYADWSSRGETTSLVAHVTDPTDEQLADWHGAEFQHVGTRRRVDRPVVADDLELAVDPPPGVRIVQLAEQPELAPSVHDLWNRAHADIPTPLSFIPVTYEAWCKEVGAEEGSGFPQSLHVAVGDGGAVVGFSYMRWVDQQAGVLGHRMTGTDPAWRGQGVGAAIKRAAIRWAAEEGATSLVASNDDDNAAMRALNNRLGYREIYRIVMFRRPM